MTKKSGFDYFDRPETRKRLWLLLYIGCGLTIIPDFFAHRQPHFGIDGFFGFYAILGFASCAVLILFSKLVGLILKVKEDYYDR